MCKFYGINTSIENEEEDEFYDDDEDEEREWCD
jgi:hypothetical protein